MDSILVTEKSILVTERFILVTEISILVIGRFILVISELQTSFFSIIFANLRESSEWVEKKPYLCTVIQKEMHQHELQELNKITILKRKEKVWYK